MPATVRLNRVLTAPPERVFRALSDPAALVKWMAPHGFTAFIHHFDFTVGGSYRMTFTNLSTGTRHSFGGTYHEIVPNERLVYSDAFDDPAIDDEMTTTLTLRALPLGTELQVTQDGLPDAIPPEACRLGWQESLTLLALLVEPDVPDA